MEEKKQILIKIGKENRVTADYYIQDETGSLTRVYDKYITKNVVEEVISFYKNYAMNDFVYKCTVILTPYLYFDDIFKIGFKMADIIKEEENKMEIIPALNLEDFEEWEKVNHIG